MKRIWPFLTVAGVVTVMLRGTLGPGYPVNLENYGSYVSKVMMLLSNGGRWFTPNWYFGYEIGRFYPPMTTALVYGLARLGADASLAFNLVAYTAYLCMALGVYAFLKREMSVVGALVAAVLFATSHVVVVGAQGFYWEIPHLIGFALIPYLLTVVRDVLITKDAGWRAAFAGVLVGVILLNNILAGVEALLLTAVYLVAVAKETEWSKDMLRSSLLAGLGFILTAGWWVVPAVFPAGVGAFTTSDSYSLGNIITVLGIGKKADHMFLFSLLSVPGVLGMFGITAAFSRPNRIDRFALILLGVSAVLVATNSPQGWRYLVDAALALSIVSGRLIERVYAYPVRSVRTIAFVMVASVAMSVAAFVIGLPGTDPNVGTSYQSEPTFIVENTVHAVMRPDDVVYIQYAQGFHDGPMAWNTYFPESRQVGGGFAAGNRNADVGRIGKFITSGAAPKTLDGLLRQYGVTYLIVNKAQLSQNGAYDALDRHYKAIYGYGDMVVLSTGYSISHAPADYRYLTVERIVGLLLSLIGGVALLFSLRRT